MGTRHTELFSESLPEQPKPEEMEIHHGIKLLQSRNNIQFLRWMDVNDTQYVTDLSGNTLLHWAAALGDLKAVKHLLDEGLDINGRNAIGSTPILCAAASCRNPGTVIDYMIRRGANTEVVNLHDETLYFLLEQRNLQMLCTLFQLLKSGMEDCPKLFSTTGVSRGNAVSFAQRGQLGSSDALVPMNNTVHFKREGAAEMSGTMDGNDTLLSNSYGLGGSNIGYNPYSTMFSATADGPLCNGTSCFASQRLAERNVHICLLQEELERVKLTNEYWVSLFFLTYEGTAPLGSDLELYERVSIGGEDTAADNVHQVLGERFNNGQRWLLVQWRAEDGVPLPEGQEEWVPFSEVKHCEAVCEYFLHYDQTCFSEVTLENSSMQSNQTPRVGLDAKEREELELELQKIAQRKLESPSASFRANQSPTAMKGGPFTTPPVSPTSSLVLAKGQDPSPTKRSTNSNGLNNSAVNCNSNPMIHPNENRNSNSINVINSLHLLSGSNDLRKQIDAIIANGITTGGGVNRSASASSSPIQNSALHPSNPPRQSSSVNRVTDSGAAALPTPPLYVENSVYHSHPNNSTNSSVPRSTVKPSLMSSSPSTVPQAYPTPTSTASPSNTPLEENPNNTSGEERHSRNGRMKMKDVEQLQDCLEDESKASSFPQQHTSLVPTRPSFPALSSAPTSKEAAAGTSAGVVNSQLAQVQGNALVRGNSGSGHRPTPGANPLAEKDLTLPPLPPVPMSVYSGGNPTNNSLSVDHLQRLFKRDRKNNEKYQPNNLGAYHHLTTSHEPAAPPIGSSTTRHSSANGEGGLKGHMDGGGRDPFQHRPKQQSHRVSPPREGSRGGGRGSSAGDRDADAWKNASFSTTISSTTSDMYIPTLGEMVMKGGYKPLQQLDFTAPPPPSTTESTASTRDRPSPTTRPVGTNLFVKEEMGYVPTNLRPKFLRGHILMSNRQTQQYNHLREASAALVKS